MNDLIATIPTAAGRRMRVYRHGETMIIHGYMLDLDGIAALVTACDDTVREIRKHQAVQAARDA